MYNNIDITQVLLLDRGGISFAIPISFVDKVIPAQEISPVNSDNPIIKGIINFKGVVMPVVSIDVRFGISEEKLSINDKLVLIEQNGKKMALIVNSVSDITELDPKQTQETDALFPGLLSVNLLEKEHKIIYLYNPEVIFTNKDIIDLNKLSEQ